LAAGLRPNPLGELKRPGPLAAIRGPTSKGRGREERAMERRGREGNLLQGVRGDRRPWSSHQLLQRATRLYTQTTTGCNVADF